MQEIGHAALAIIPSFDSFEGKLESGSSKAMLTAGASGGRKLGSAAGDEATKGISSKITDWSKKGAIAIGGAAGFAVGYGLREGLAREAIGDKVAASLGLDPKAQQQQGKIAGSLYAHAFGESYEDVANAVAAATSSLPKLQGNGEIRRASRDALNFAAVFDVDIPRAVSVAGTVINSKLAPNAKAAFDLLTRSSQKVPAALREDILDAAEEYSQFFHSLGYDGPAAFDLLVAGSKQGMYGIDKAGDAIKEFTIRSTDGSKLTGTALESIGLDAEAMSNKILKGGDDAQAATQKIIQGLLDIEDPSQRANTAIALFGTPIEDLNVSKIPAFLKALQGTSGELDNVKGAAERMGDTLNDNTSTKITALKRKLETDLVEFMSKKGLPALESFSDWMTKDGLPALDKVTDYAGTAADKVGTLVGAFNDLPDAGKIAALGGALAGGLVIKHKLSGIFDRGGPANPMFVVVTNPSLGAGGSTGGGFGVTDANKFGKIAGAAMAASIVVAAIPLVDSIAKSGGLDDWLKGSPFDATELGNKLGLPDWFAGDDPKKDEADSRSRTEHLNDLWTAGDRATGTQQKLGAATDVTRGKFAAFFPEVNKSKNGIKDLKRQGDLLTATSIKPNIDTTSIERAIEQVRTLNAELAVHASPERGIDNGVGYQHGGGNPPTPLPDSNGRAGVTNHFHGGIHGSTIPDVIKYADRASRRRGHGGVGG